MTDTGHAEREGARWTVSLEGWIEPALGVRKRVRPGVIKAAGWAKGEPIRIRKEP